MNLLMSYSLMSCSWLVMPGTKMGEDGGWHVNVVYLALVRWLSWLHFVPNRWQHSEAPSCKAGSSKATNLDLHFVRLAAVLTGKPILFVLGIWMKLGTNTSTVAESDLTCKVL